MLLLRFLLWAQRGARFYAMATAYTVNHTLIEVSKALLHGENHNFRTEENLLGCVHLKQLWLGYVWAEVSSFLHVPPASGVNKGFLCGGQMNKRQLYWYHQKCRSNRLQVCSMWAGALIPHGSQLILCQAKLSCRDESPFLLSSNSLLELQVLFSQYLI